MVANEEARMSNNEGMTKIRMPNLLKSVQSADDLTSVIFAFSVVKNNFAA